MFTGSDWARFATLFLGWIAAIVGASSRGLPRLRRRLVERSRAFLERWLPYRLRRSRPWRASTLQTSMMHIRSTSRNLNVAGFFLTQSDIPRLDERTNYFFCFPQRELKIGCHSLRQDIERRGLSRVSPISQPIFDRKLQSRQSDPLEIHLCRRKNERPNLPQRSWCAPCLALPGSRTNVPRVVPCDSPG
jgi:hypothetical protein